MSGTCRPVGSLLFALPRSSLRPRRPAERLREAVTVVTCEPLEPRRLFSTFPTPFEQYVLELINRARANPGAEVARLSNKTWGDDPALVPGTAFPQPQTPDLNEGLPAGTIPNTPKPPLAFNPDLTQAARDYSNTLLTNDQNLTHTFNGTDPTSRVQAAGYNGVAGENLSVRTSSQALPISAAIAETLHDDLFIDNNVTGRGHRTNLMNSTSGYREIGIGLGASTSYTALGGGTPNAVLVTEDFGVPNNSNPILTGVVFTDNNSNSFFDPGEGLGNVTITATRTSDNMPFSTTTWDAGGYSLPLPAGTYSVSASGGGASNPAPVMVTVGTDNVEQDFTLAGTANAAPAVTTQPQAQTVVAGNTATFTAAASGTPTPGVQWQASATQNGAFTDIPGATSATLSFPAQLGDSGKRYRAVFTNSQGTATSDPVTLTVTSAGPALMTALSGALPSAAVGGAKTTAAQTLSITNNSGQTLAGPATVTLFLSTKSTLDGSATQVSTFSTRLNVKAGATKSLVARLKSLPNVPDGQYFVLAQVTSGSNSSVAASANTVKVAAPFTDLSGSGLSVAPASLAAGTKATVALTVTNSGNVAAAGTLGVQLFAASDAAGSNPQVLGTLTTRINLKAQAHKLVKLRTTVPSGTPSGTFFLVAVLDPTNTFTDPDRSNNTVVDQSPVTFS